LAAAMSTRAASLNAPRAEEQDASNPLREYLEALESDPAALEETAQRLFLIGDLKRKYGESVPAILEYATDAQRRLDEIEHRTERLGELEAREEQTRSQLSAAAVALSNARRAAADELAREVER